MMRQLSRSSLAVGLSLLVPVTTDAAGASPPYCPWAALSPPPAADVFGFGRSIAKAGDDIAIGTLDVTNGWPALELVYTFRRSRESGAWEPGQILAPPDPGPNTEFGVEVVMGDDLLVVGAPGVSHGGLVTGSVFVYRRQGDLWVEEAELFREDGPGVEPFGRTLDLGGDRIVVGRPGTDDRPEGAAFVYQFDPDSSQWLPEATLLDPNPPPAPSDFAFRVAIAPRGDRILVGGWGDEGKCAFVFRHDETTGAWVAEAHLSVGWNNSIFGTTFAMDIWDDLIVLGTLVIGEPAATPLTLLPGAFVYRHCGGEPGFDEGPWQLEASVNSPFFGHFHDGDRFVAIRDDTLVLGARSSYYGDAKHVGAVFVFRRQMPPPASGEPSAWVLDQMIVNPGDVEFERFGSQVALDDDDLVISSDSELEPYLFTRRTTPDCNHNGAFDGCDLFSGPSVDENDNGIPDECEPRFADLNGDGIVNGADLMLLIAAWGDCPPPPEHCPADLDLDGTVGIVDLLRLLAAWG